MNAAAAAAGKVTSASEWNQLKKERDISPAPALYRPNAAKSPAAGSEWNALRRKRKRIILDHTY